MSTEYDPKRSWRDGTAAALEQRGQHSPTAVTAEIVAEHLDADDELSFRSAASRGLALSTVTIAIKSVLGLVGFAVLARFLSPTDYGVASLASVFIVLLSAVAASGMGPALVQRETVDRAYVDTMFWLSAATGLVLALGLSALAFPLAMLFGQPLLGPVLIVLSVTFVLVGISSVHLALLQRAFRFAVIARASVVANVVATAVGIAFAVLHFGVWALVVQTVLSPALVSIELWRVSAYRPRRAFHRDHVGPIYRVSSQFLGQTTMDFLGQQADNFLVGARLGVVALGIYSVAYRILGVMMDVLSNSLRQAALPMFATLQSAQERLRTAYLSAIGLSASVVMPCFAFLFAAAPQMVLVVFGAKWQATIPIARVFALYGMLEAVMVINQVFLQGAGSVRTAFRLSAAGTGLQVVGFVIAVPFGLIWVAAAYVIRSYLLAPFGLARAVRIIGLPIRSCISQIARPLACAGVMAAVVFLVGRRLSATADAVQLLSMALVGATTYALLALFLMRTHVLDARRFVSAALGEKPGHP